MSVVRFRRALLVALAATVALALPASAHPFIEGGALPVDSLATMTLTMAHGCGGDDGGEREPTTEVALEVPDWLRVVEVADAPGYVSERETAADGSVEAVVWTADGAGEPATEPESEAAASDDDGGGSTAAVVAAVLVILVGAFTVGRRRGGGRAEG